jgi:hypothetical protein
MILGQYTSQKGLMGIVENREVWATNIRFLNDDAEFVHANDMFARWLPELVPDHPATRQHRQAFIDEIARGFALFRGGPINQPGDGDLGSSEAIFVASFTEATDLLSQWRGYCPQHNGYCMLFDPEQIALSAKHKFPHSELVPCVYSDEEKKDRLRQILSAGLMEYIESDDRYHVTGQISLRINKLAAQCKHSGFHEEREHRLIVVLFTRNDVKFREGKYCLIPYVAVPLTRGLVTLNRVVIGPTPYPQLAAHGARELLMAEYSAGISTHIQHSAIPYRAW